MSLDIEHLPLEVPSELNAVYGNPDGGHGHADPSWEWKNIVRLIPPYPMKFSWGPAVKSLPVHKLIHDPLMAVFEDIHKLLGTDLAHYGMDLTGGAYNFRLMRGSSHSLSVHSWGAAIDMDPAHNPWPHQWVDGHGMVRKDVVAIFEKHGAHWRGKNGDNDPMHFQWCRHRAAY